MKLVNTIKIIIIIILFIPYLIFSEETIIRDEVLDENNKPIKRVTPLENKYFNVSLRLQYFKYHESLLNNVISENENDNDIEEIKIYKKNLNRYIEKIDSLKNTLEKKVESIVINETNNKLNLLNSYMQSKLLQKMKERYKTLIETGKKNFDELENALKTKIRGICSNCRIIKDKQNIIIRITDEGWFNSGSSKLKKNAHPILDKITEIFVSNNHTSSLGITIRAHTDSDGKKGYKWYREIATWRTADEDIRKNTALDIIDDEGEISDFVHYYQYRLIPSRPSGESVVVLYNQAYIDNLDYNLQLSRDRAKSVDEYMRKSSLSYDSHDFETKYIGVAFLEPIVQNHPVNYSRYNDAKEFKKLKSKNRRIEFAFFISYRRIIKLIQREEWGLIRKYLRNN